MLILLLVKWALRVEVVHTTISILPTNAFAFHLLMMLVVTSQVSEQVTGPAANLLADKHPGGPNRRLLQQLVHLMQNVAHLCGVLLASTRQEDHVPLHVAGGFVVLAMADLPTEVRDQQGRVTKPADSIIERLAWRKRLVAALVCQDPKASAKKALDEGVATPETCSNRCRRHILRRAVCVE